MGNLGSWRNLLLRRRLQLVMITGRFCFLKRVQGTGDTEYVMYVREGKRGGGEKAVDKGAERKGVGGRREETSF